MIKEGKPDVGIYGNNELLGVVDCCRSGGWVVVGIVLCNKTVGLAVGAGEVSSVAAAEGGYTV